VGPIRSILPGGINSFIHSSLRDDRAIKDKGFPRLWRLTTRSTNTRPIHALGGHCRAAETRRAMQFASSMRSILYKHYSRIIIVKRCEKEIRQQGGYQKAILVKIETTNHRPPLRHTDCKFLEDERGTSWFSKQNV
jgi:hypothetical protein